MKLRIQKTYENGATQTAYIDDRDETAHRAKIDAEDREAGLVGVWTVEVRKVY